MTFAVHIRGATIAMGEAFDFKWFDAGTLPDEADFGFGQLQVIKTILPIVDFDNLV